MRQEVNFSGDNVLNFKPHKQVLSVNFMEFDSKKVITFQNIKTN